MITMTENEKSKYMDRMNTEKYDASIYIAKLNEIVNLHNDVIQGIENVLPDEVVHSEKEKFETIYIRLPELSEASDDINKDDYQVDVLVVGGANVGKSTLVNSILGERVFDESMLNHSDYGIVFGYSPTAQLVKFMTNGENEAIAVDEYNSFAFDNKFRNTDGDDIDGFLLLHHSDSLKWLNILFAP